MTLALATSMHLDWHVARPAVHHLSLGWQWHWLLAIPVFALTAWYVRRAWPGRLLATSVTIVATASVLAAIVEPAWEYVVDSASFEWAFGRIRLAAFGEFLVAGVIAHTAVLALTRRRGRQSH